MMTTTRHLAASLIVPSLLLLSLSPASAQEPAPSPSSGTGGDSSAVAVNTRDDSTVFRFTFHLRRANGEVVDTQNAAVAFSSCDSCQTVAISIQTVFVLGDPTIVTPGNYAIAINWDCTDCETLASAYQFVLGTGDPVHLSAEGNQAIAEIRRAIRALGAGDLSVFEIQAALGVLVDQLQQVLATELVMVGPEEEADPDTAAGDAEGSADPASSDPTPTPEDGQPVEEVDASSPSPEVTPSPEASPDPSPSP